MTVKIEKHSQLILAVGLILLRGSFCSLCRRARLKDPSNTPNEAPRVPAPEPAIAAGAGSVPGCSVWPKASCRVHGDKWLLCSS